MLGYCSGAIGGLATITPAAGFVSPGAALVIGVAAGLGTYLACTKLKSAFMYDDSLDTFGVHAVGGTMGTIFAGVFANTASNPNLDAANNAAVKANGLAALVGNGLWLEQLKAAAIWIVWSVVATVVIAYVVKALIGLRPSEEVETIGLDLSEHGEEGYNG